MPLAIEMKDITKRFPGGVTANDHIHFEVERQKIHSLLGENGTGKTTLMNILFGLYHADEGSIYIDGSLVNITNPRVALKHGLGMVHQHFMLVNRMTVLENIILGHEHGKYTLDIKKSHKVINELSERYGFKLDLGARIVDLSVGMKQRVEILKTLYRGADIIILDEPTAVLTPPEVEELFVILSELRSKGKTIIFITHKLNETMEIADRITVLRNGRNVTSVYKKDTSPEELARYMVGREVNFTLEKKKRKPGKKVLSLQNVRLLPKARSSISLDIHEGEIVGIAGVEGNGQLELEEIIMGLRRVTEGSVFLDGQDITSLSTRARKNLGIGYIPSDRHKRAMLGNFSIRENFLLGYQHTKRFSSKGVIRQQDLKNHSLKMIEEFDVRASSADQKIRQLSGGNQQKIILAREVSQNPDMIIAAQPIRGLDIGAIEYVHSLLLRLRNEGKAILLISAELSEVMEMSDRIAVLYEGDIVALKGAESFKREEIGLLMAGESEGNADEGKK